MKKDIIEQATQTLNNDLSKTQKTKEVIEKMVEALNEHRIDDIGEFFENNFNWFGNFGCGTKIGLKEFQQNWQVPFQKAFSEKVCIDEARIFEGEWGAAFGRQEAIHTGTFMGIKPTNKKVNINYMDFWHVKNNKIIMPIVSQVYSILFDKKNPEIAINQLMDRKLKHEMIK